MDGCLLINYYVTKSSRFVVNLGTLEQVDNDVFGVLQEICYYGFIIVLYFFADVFLGIHACTVGHKAGDVSGHVLH